MKDPMQVLMLLLVNIWVSLSKLHRESSLMPVACPFSNYRYEKYYATILCQYLNKFFKTLFFAAKTQNPVD